MNQTAQLRQLIRESIQEYIREIDEAGNRAALEAKINATQEAIDKRKKITAMEGLDEAYQEYLDKNKMKEMTSEIKMLEKSLAKYGKMFEKMDAKNSPKVEEMNNDADEIIDEVNIDPPSGTQLEGDKPEAPSHEETDANQVYERLLMQRRAGILSETEYIKALEEAKKEKSSLIKKDKNKDKDKDKK
jgi:hypothetical protein